MGRCKTGPADSSACGHFVADRLLFFGSQYVRCEWEDLVILHAHVMAIELLQLVRQVPKLRCVLNRKVPMSEPRLTESVDLQVVSGRALVVLLE